MSQSSKLQFLYVPGHFAQYMCNLHQDDIAGGMVVRIYDRPTDHAKQALLVLPSHTKDMSVDLVLEEAECLGQVSANPVRVEFDPAFDGGNAMWIRQDMDAVVVRSPQHAIDIAMRLLLWAALEQEKENV